MPAESGGVDSSDPIQTSFSGGENQNTNKTSSAAQQGTVNLQPADDAATSKLTAGASDKQIESHRSTGDTQDKMNSVHPPSSVSDDVLLRRNPGRRVPTTPTTPTSTTERRRFDVVQNKAYSTTDVIDSSSGSGRNVSLGYQQSMIIPPPSNDNALIATDVNSNHKSAAPAAAAVTSSSAADGGTRGDGDGVAGVGVAAEEEALPTLNELVSLAER